MKMACKFQEPAKLLQVIDKFIQFGSLLFLERSFWSSALDVRMRVHQPRVVSVCRHEFGTDKAITWTV